MTAFSAVGTSAAGVTAAAGEAGVETVSRTLATAESTEVIPTQAVALGVQTKRDLSEMDLSELQAFSDLIHDDVFEVLTVEGSVDARNHTGGTAPNQVRAAAARAKARLEAR